MYKVLRKERLAEDTHLIELEAPLVAQKVMPGNFVMLRIAERSEKVPMSVADFNPAKGTITTVFKTIGKTTYDLADMKAGDAVANFVGPLGHATEIKKFGTVVLVGGGAGIPALYPIANGMRKAGNHVISIIGARSKNLVIYEKEMKKASSELLVATDDGSYGTKGFVSDVLLNLIKDGREIDRVITVGPLIMMKTVANVTKPYSIKTIVSLNPIMVDGTGMCGCCRVTVGGETRFACVDGPEFDGHAVDFDNVILRNKRFLEEEARAMKLRGETCGCGKEKA